MSAFRVISCLFLNHGVLFTQFKKLVEMHVQRQEILNEEAKIMKGALDIGTVYLPKRMILHLPSTLTCCVGQEL